MSDEQERLKAVNEMIVAIASCGREFFKHKGGISRMELDHRGRVWFVDSWNGRQVFTHYKYDWRGFSEGGTLRALVQRFRDYIKKGMPIKHDFGPWPEWYSSGDTWGYGKENMQALRDRAIELGMLHPTPAAKGETRQ